MTAFRGQADAGSVTAELAVALPAVVLVIGLALGGVQAAGLQVRITDAAADAARALARGDGASAGGRVARAVPGAALLVGRDGDEVCASVQVAAGGTLLSGIMLSATSCAIDGGR